MFKFIQSLGFDDKFIILEALFVILAILILFGLPTSGLVFLFYLLKKIIDL